jgi:hypothetical protein
MVAHLMPEEDFPFLLHSLFSTGVSRALGTGKPDGEDNITILQLKWLSGKMKYIATSKRQCLLPTQPAVSPIA